MLTATYVTPPSELVLMVDKLSSELFNLDEDELFSMIKDRNKVHSFQETEPCYEKKSSKRKNDATTKFQLQCHRNLTENIKLTFFDQIILSACMTEYLHGNKIITPNIIYRDLGGKTYSTKNFIEHILQSLEKLTQLEIRLNAKEANKFLFQLKGDKFKDVRYGFVLPAEKVDVKLNGQLCKAYRITELSVVFEYALSKGHVTKLPINIFNIPHTKNTLMFMLLKIYLYNRVLRIGRKLAHTKKKSEKITQSIRLDTMYQVCGFTEQIKQRKFRMDLMKQITTFMNHLIKNKVITSFQLVDDNKVQQKHLRNCSKILFDTV